MLFDRSNRVNSVSSTPNKRPRNAKQMAALALAVGMTMPAILPSSINAEGPLGANIVLAADKLSDAELLTQGGGQYAAGNFEEAQATLQQVKPDGLSEADQKKLQALVSQVEDALGKRKQSRAEFELGEAALADKKYGDAVAHYKAAQDNQFSDAATREKAKSQVAVAEAGLGAGVQDAKQSYEKGVAEYKKGDWSSARKDLIAARDGGYKPGGLFGGDAPETILARMDAKEAADRQAGQAQTGTTAPPVQDSPELQHQAELKATYAQAVSEYNNHQWSNARQHLKTLRDQGFKPGAFDPSPVTLLARMDAKDKADADRADAEQRSASARATRNAADQEAGAKSQDATKAYATGRDQYNRGDWINARKNFMVARDAGYRPGLFEDSPGDYLARMDKKEAADARENQRRIALAQAAGTTDTTPNALPVNPGTGATGTGTTGTGTPSTQTPGTGTRDWNDGHWDDGHWDDGHWDDWHWNDWHWNDWHWNDWHWDDWHWDDWHWDDRHWDDWYWDRDPAAFGG